MKKTKIRYSELINQVIKFNSLSYSEKLEHWHEFKKYTDNSILSTQFYLNLRLNFEIDIDIELTEETPRLFISIHPKNPEEFKLYISWLSEKLKKSEEYNFEEQISKIINKDSQNIEYLENERTNFIGLYMSIKTYNDKDFIENGFNFAMSNFKLTDLLGFPMIFQLFLKGYRYGYFIKQIEIQISNLKKEKLPMDETEEININSSILKIMFLYELGIFDFIKSKYESIDSKELNETELSKIIATFTDIKTDTIRQNYREIEGIKPSRTIKPFDDPKKTNLLKTIIRDLKIKKKGNP